MSKVEPVPSRAQTLLAVGRVSGKHTTLSLAGAELHFWDSVPVALLTGGCVWHRVASEPATTKMLNAISPTEAPRIRASASQFDFMIGQALTSAGLPLTASEK